MDKGLFGLLVAFLIFPILFSYFRGFKRSIVRLAFVAGSGIVSFFASNAIAKSIAASIPLNIAEMGMVGKIIERSTTLAALVSELPRMLIAPIIFGVLFVLLCLITYIPCAIINRNKEKGDKKNAAAGIGVAIGVLSFVLMLAPLSAQLSTLIKGVSYISEEGWQYIASAVNVELPEGTGEALKNSAKNSTVTMALGKVGRPMMNYFAGTKVDGKDIYLLDEIEKLFPLIPQALSIVNQSPGEETTLPLPELVEAAKNSEILSDVLDGIIEETVKEVATPELLDNKQIMKSASKYINEINQGKDIKTLTLQALKEIGLDTDAEISDAVYEYLKGFITEHFAGSDWDATKLKQFLTEFKAQ